jgi:hypothetical protein
LAAPDLSAAPVEDDDGKLLFDRANRILEANKGAVSTSDRDKRNSLEGRRTEPLQSPYILTVMMSTIAA